MSLKKYPYGIYLYWRIILSYLDVRLVQRKFTNYRPTETAAMCIRNVDFQKEDITTSSSLN